MKLDVCREIFCFASASDIAGSIRRDARRLFHSLITRSSVEEMKSERDRKGGANRNWRNYDFKRLSLRPPLSSRFFLHASSPLLSGGKKENAREKPPSPSASLKLPRFTTESHSFKLLSDLNTALARDTQTYESRMYVSCAFKRVMPGPDIR